MPRRYVARDPQFIVEGRALLARREYADVVRICRSRLLTLQTQRRSRSQSEAETETSHASADDCATLWLATEAPTATLDDGADRCAAETLARAALTPTSTVADDVAAEAVPAIDDAPGVPPDGRTRNRSESSTGQTVPGTRSMIRTSVVLVLSQP